MTSSDHEEDRELMLRVAKRDLDAYRQLVHKHLVKYTRFAERMIGSHADAKDIMQDVCLKLWNNPTAWQPTSPFTTWLYRVLFNACIDYKRKKKFFTDADFERFEEPSPNQESVLIGRQTEARVKDAIGQLPERQRVALILCYYEDASNQQAAEALGVGVGALQQLLFRARQNLKELLLPMNDNQEESHG